MSEDLLHAEIDPKIIHNIADNANDTVTIFIETINEVQDIQRNLDSGQQETGMGFHVPKA